MSTPLPICEKLRRTVPGYVGTLSEDGRATYRESPQEVLRNPDGPEAADTIDGLHHYLELALAVLDRANVVWVGEPDARALLARVRNES